MYLFVYQPEESNIFYAINEQSIKSIPLSETYDENGIPVDAFQAGDSIEILSQSLAKKTKTKVGDIIYAFDNYKKYCQVLSKIESHEEFIENEDYHHYKLYIDGFNYWDGHKFKTFVLNSDDPNAYLPYRKCEDADIVRVLNEALDYVDFSNYEQKPLYYLWGYEKAKMTITKPLTAVWYQYRIEITPCHVE